MEEALTVTQLQDLPVTGAFIVCLGSVVADG